MEQLTSTPQRVPETNAEYEKLIGDNCSVYSDVSRLASPFPILVVDVNFEMLQKRGVINIYLYEFYN